MDREDHIQTLRDVIAQNELSITKVKSLLADLEARRSATETQMRNRSSAREIKHQLKDSEN